MTAIKEKFFFVEKKPEFHDEANRLLYDLKTFLKIEKLKKLRVINIYKLRDNPSSNLRGIFDTPQTDMVYTGDFPLEEDEYCIGIRYLKGQYDSRAHWANECMQILIDSSQTSYEVETAKIIVVNRDIGDADLNRIKKYLINAVECEEFEIREFYKENDTSEIDSDTAYLSEIKDFIHFDETALLRFMEENRLAMSIEDLKKCQSYFRGEENRNPSFTEIKVIDTYWSDHCRHKTFRTRLSKIDIQENPYTETVKQSLEHYLKVKTEIDPQDEVTLMDVATIAAKELKNKGLLDDLEVSDENNACSIVIEVDVNEGDSTKTQEWLLMFKNETHNHPTEIEPYGGAATCLGGAIRDPLSGRSYVYQAMRISGGGDPNRDIADTMEGKLPSKKIAVDSAKGFSSYGNQIGITTGIVEEFYDEGFIAKRMEVGAVIGAVQKSSVLRQNPQKGDDVLLIGGRTGRDGIGGATGSSKTHNTLSVEKAQAEVQKGNPVEERKLQRLFRNREATLLMKKCNDFGAGGVSVAVGELAEGLAIYLDRIPKKYTGLNAMELAISESQERMAVVVAPENTQKLIDFCEEENLEATVIAKVTDNHRIVMEYANQKVVDIKREFLDSNGYLPSQEACLSSPNPAHSPFYTSFEKDFEQGWRNICRDMNATIKKGLQDIFDTTIGVRTVLMPLGGKYQLTPIQSMVAKIPVENLETSTVSMMSFGYCPEISKWSAFHGGFYALIDSIGKTVASGGNYRKIRFSLQEYFQKMTDDPIVWGKPLGALLGAYYVQYRLGIPAVGGKDSMSGSFNEYNVPPTLIAFAVSTGKINTVISPEFKKPGSTVFLLRTPYLADFTLDLEAFRANADFVEHNIKDKTILSCYAIGFKGISEALIKMCAGNALGITLEESFEPESLFQPMIGSFLFEVDSEDADFYFHNHCTKVGKTNTASAIDYKTHRVSMKELLKDNIEKLQRIYPTDFSFERYRYEKSETVNKPETKKVNFILKHKPIVFLPVFPGTNCEYDMGIAFQKAGAQTESFVLKNLNIEQLDESMKIIAERITCCNILALSGGFSAGDEPDGSAKYISILLQNERIKDAIYQLIEKKGLIIGICNGFQALIKTGLLPYGKYVEIDTNPFILTNNKNGRHISTFVEIEITSNHSPWLSLYKAGERIKEPISHGEGRLCCDQNSLQHLIRNNQISTRYIHNPNGSVFSIEGLISQDGRILGKMAHSERIDVDLYKNIPDIRESLLFKSGVAYFSYSE
jgi:phosphoribosylformylglycinamidine synthase